MLYQGREIIISKGVGLDCNLLLLLSGTGGSAATLQTAMDIESTLSDDYTVCYVPPKDGYWKTSSESSPEDLLYLSGLLSFLVYEENDATYSVDHTNVNICGMSGGSLMLAKMVRNIPFNFKSMVSISGTIPDYQTFLFDGKILHIHGTEDVTIPYEGNTTTAAINTIGKDIKARGMSFELIPVFGAGHAISSLKTNDTKINDKIKMFLEG